MRLRSCFSSVQLAEKHLNRAKRIIYGTCTETDLIVKDDKITTADMEIALSAIDSALELRPRWEQALELKARTLIYLKRFRDVVEMLHEYVPSLLLLQKTAEAQPPSQFLSPAERFLSPPSPLSSCPSSSTPSSVASSPSSSCNSNSSSSIISTASSPLQITETLTQSSSPSSSCDSNSISKPTVADHSFLTKKDEITSSLGIVSPLLLSPATSVARLRQELSSRYPVPEKKTIERKQQWRFFVLGQACFHLGMIEDAMVLLQNIKRTASADSRRRSNAMREDNFSSEIREQRSITLNPFAFKAACTNSDIQASSTRSAIKAAESDHILVTEMLSDIKFLLSRRSTAMASLEAELYSESIRHFSKIIDGRRGLIFNTPPDFLADCFLHRSIAYQASHKIVDAIADCNKTLTLNPHSTKALSLRASIYESVCCFSESLLDLQQLKMIYEAFYRYRLVASQSSIFSIASSPPFSDTDLSSINARISSIRQKLSRSGSEASMDCYTILDLPRVNGTKANRFCSIEDVERAYILTSLKHRPDKAALFLERSYENIHIAENDLRDLDTVKEEAKACAIRLSRLIHRAYTKLLSDIADEAELRTVYNTFTDQKREDSIVYNLAHVRRIQRKRIYQETVKKYWTSDIKHNYHESDAARSEMGR